MTRHRYPLTTKVGVGCLIYAALLLVIHEAHPPSYGADDLDRWGWIAFLVAGILCLMPRFAFPALGKFFDVVSAWWGRKSSPSNGDGAE